MEREREIERVVGGVKNAKGVERCYREGLENCSSVGKSPTCSSQIFTSISVRLELNLEWHSDRSLYPSVSTSPFRMWSVERVSTRDPDPEKQIPASSFEFHSTNIYIYRVIRVELYKLYRVIIFFFRSLFEEGRKIRINFFWKNLHQLLRLNFKDFIANSLIDSFPVSTSRYLFDKFTLSHSYNPLNNTNSREKDKFEINAE